MSTDTRDAHITIGDIGPLDTVTTQADGMRERRRAAIGLVYTALETAKTQDDVKAKKVAAFEALAKRRAGPDGEPPVDKESTEMDSDAGKKGGDKPYGDVPYADHGKQPDGKKRYPLDTPEHIRAAWNYIHKKKNASKYTASQLAAIKRRIISAWKSKISKDGPPEASEE